MAEGAPESRGLDEELEPDVAFELLVAGRGLIPRDGVGDVGADVERGRSAARPSCAARSRARSSVA